MVEAVVLRNGYQSVIHSLLDITVFLRTMLLKIADGTLSREKYHDEIVKYLWHSGTFSIHVMLP